MKMKWMPVAAILVAALTVPAIAQEGEKETESARKVNLTLKHEKDQTITESKESSTHVKIGGGGMVFQEQWASETGTKVSEILEVNDKGKIIKARVKWSDGKTVAEAEEMGQPGEPVEMESDLNGASILYTWNEKTEEYDSKVEEGDANGEGMKEQLEKTDPFVNPFVPGREVKVGESWDADEEGLKKMFAGDDNITVKEVSGTCKAEEIIEENGAELLVVKFDVEVKGVVQDESLDNPDLDMTVKGSYHWDIKNGRIASVEMENEGSFEAETQGPQGAMQVNFNMTAEEVLAMEYGKIEAEAEDEDVEEGGMD